MGQRGGVNVFNSALGLIFAWYYYQVVLVIAVHAAVMVRAESSYLVYWIICATGINIYVIIKWYAS